MSSTEVVRLIVGSAAGVEAEHDSKSHEGCLRGHAAEPDRIGNGDAFAVGNPVVELVGDEVIVAHARNVRLMNTTMLKSCF